MNIQQKIWRKEKWKIINDSLTESNDAQLVLAFSSKKSIEELDLHKILKSDYPNANIVICSTSGEIIDESVYDDSVSVTAINFEKTAIEIFYEEIGEDNITLGERISNKLSKDDLKHVFLLSDGLKINGTKLIEGINKNLNNGVSVTGGLSGDGADFKSTLVGLNEAPQNNKIVAIGLYNKDLKVSYGSSGGWEKFGIERKVTKSIDNVLYEIDGEPALDLYKNYLGEQAKELPASALLFPLSMSSNDNQNTALVRTILSIDEETKSMTFAGDIPEGSNVFLMRADNKGLTNGSKDAAKNASKIMTNGVELALLVSCVGRKLVMNQFVEDEIEAVRDVLGDKTVLAGFYSYGELAPSEKNGKCKLHNQTMTLTLISE